MSSTLHVEPFQLDRGVAAKISPFWWVIDPRGTNPKMIEIPLTHMDEVLSLKLDVPPGTDLIVGIGSAVDSPAMVWCQTEATEPLAYWEV